MVDSTSSLQAIALLIDQLNSQDSKKRLNSVRNLSTIATALGPQRTRNELLLFLNDLIDDDDEILITLAESLQNMIAYVGGPAYVMSLIQLLQHLCKVQETKVREKATDAIKSILSQCKIGDFQMQLYECIKRLYTSDWFTAKLPVCTLIPFIYPYCSSKVQLELFKLSEDSIPQVRKTAAQYLKDFIALIPKLQKPPERQLLAIFQKLSKDEHDSVKILAMDNCLEFMKVLPSGKAAAGLLPFIKAYAQNQAWRLRYLVADKIVEIGMGMGTQNVQTHLLSYYIKFLQDPESEVRTAAVSRLANFCKMIHPDEIVKKICNLLKPISTDSFQYVRSALADNILFLCPLVGKFNTNEHIVGVFLNLLRDESPDVRLNLFKGLQEFNKIIGIQNLAQSLVPAINQLATNKNWRTRLTIIQKFPGQGFFSQKFGSICLDWLNDQVFAIRDAAINNLKQLCQVVGPKWMQKNAIPKIISFQRDTNYLYRLTTLFAIQKLAEYLPLQSFQRVMVPAILIMANDKVPNVRMNVARTLHQCKKYVKDKDVQARVAQVLVQLLKDSDFDVAYTAKKAL